MAEKFAKLLNSKRVKNINANFLDQSPILNAYDLIIMVDIVFQIISPLYDNAEDDTLRWVIKSLRHGSFLFMEIEDFSYLEEEIVKSGGQVRKWVEFPKGDPFQYVLHLIEMDCDGNIVFNKTHIRRDKIERDFFKNVIKSYSKKDIKKLLEKYGFEVSIYPGEFDEGEYQGTERFRVLAKKIIRKMTRSFICF